MVLNNFGFKHLDLELFASIHESSPTSLSFSLSHFLSLSIVFLFVLVLILLVQIVFSLYVQFSLLILILFGCNIRLVAFTFLHSHPCYVLRQFRFKFGFLYFVDDQLLDYVGLDCDQPLDGELILFQAQPYPIYHQNLEVSLMSAERSMKYLRELSSMFLEDRLMLRGEVNLLVWEREQPSSGRENSIQSKLGPRVATFVV